jgi:hypothetical protein
MVGYIARLSSGEGGAELRGEGGSAPYGQKSSRNLCVCGGGGWKTARGPRYPSFCIISRNVDSLFMLAILDVLYLRITDGLHVMGCESGSRAEYGGHSLLQGRAHCSTS